MVNNITNYWVENILNDSNQLAHAYTIFSKQTPLTIDELYQSTYELEQLYTRTKQKIDYIKEQIAILKRQPLDDLSNRKITSLEASFLSILALKDRISAVSSKYRTEFDLAKKGITSRNFYIIHPRCLFPTDQTHQEGLQFQSERAICRFPIGISNPLNNCWAISLLQLLLNVPALRDHLLLKLPNNYSELKKEASIYLIDQWQNETTPGSHAISRLSSQTFREQLSLLFRGIISPSMHDSEDAYEAFCCLFNHLENPENNPLFTEMTTIRKYDVPNHHPLKPLLGTETCDLDHLGTSRTKNLEFQIFLNLQNQFDVSFEELTQKAFICQEGELGNYSGYSLPFVEERRVFSQLPKHFLFCLKRFAFTSFGSEKIHTDILIPEKYVLPSRFTQTNQYGLYQLKAFITHLGTYSGGHYIAIIRLDNGAWIECNDRNIKILAPQQFRQILNQAYITYFELEREIFEEEALSIIQNYPRSSVQAIPKLTETKREDAKQLETLITANDLEAKAHFAGLSDKVKIMFYHLKWLNDKRPSNPDDYGHIEVDKNSSCLKEIHKSWILSDSGSILSQYLLKLKDEENIAKLQKDKETLHLISCSGIQTENRFKELLFDALSAQTKQLLKNRFGNKSNIDFYNFLITCKIPIFTSRENHPLYDQLQEHLSKQIKEVHKELSLKSLHAIKELLNDPELIGDEIYFPLEILKEINVFIYNLILNTIAVKNKISFQDKTAQLNKLKETPHMLLDPNFGSYIHSSGGSLIDQCQKILSKS